MIPLSMVLFIIPIVVSGENWRQTDWSGGDGQLTWSDTTKYWKGENIGYVGETGDLKLGFSGWRATTSLPEPTVIYALLSTDNDTLYAGGFVLFGPGVVYRSTDRGTSWQNTGSLPDVQSVSAILQAGDGALYIGTTGLDSNGQVYKSVDGGENWQLTGPLEGTTWIFSLLETNDGKIYAGTGPEGKVFYSTDGGNEWRETGPIGDPDADMKLVYCLMQASDGSIFAGLTSYYAGGLNIGAIYRSNNGYSWAATTPLPDSVSDISALAEDAEGRIFVGAGGTDRVYITSDSGESWTKSAALENAIAVDDIIWGVDDRLYASTFGYSESGYDGQVFTSSDGQTWEKFGRFYDLQVFELSQTRDGIVFANTGVDPNETYRIYVTANYTSGYLVSSVFDAGPTGRNWATMSWDATLNGGQVEFKVRTAPNSDMTGATHWDNCPSVENGEDISELASVENGDRYIQYRVELSTPDFTRTPVLHEVAIEYSTAIKEQQLRYGWDDSKLLTILPNPFRDKTELQFEVSSSQWVFLKVYDVTGRLVQTLIDGKMAPGFYKIEWDGRDFTNMPVPPGAYFFHLKTGKASTIIKVIRTR